MKKFLLKSFIFLSIVSAAALVLPWIGPSKATSTEYLAAMADKHQSAKKITTPKILLAGGSNLVFGIDSEQLTAALGKPVLNLGLHAQLGLSFILNELKDVATQGDVIILSIEHIMPLEGNKKLQQMVAYYHPKALTYSSGKQKSLRNTFLNNHHIHYKKTMMQYLNLEKKDPIYTRGTFNSYGDGTNHLTMTLPNKLGSKTQISTDKGAEIKLLNDFYTYTQQKGITVLFSYGAYAKSEYLKNKKIVTQFDEQIRQHLHIAIISSATDFVYPDAYFFDSVYHLNKKGRTIHTQKLITKLLQRSAF